MPSSVSRLREIRCLGNSFAKRRRNEGDFFRIAHGNIAQHEGSLVDANEYVALMRSTLHRAEGSTPRWKT